MLKKIILLTNLLLLLLPQSALAQLGAGVGLGTVSIDQVLIPGGIYELPRLPVINTGEISANYSLKALPLTSEPNFLAPKPAWFSFSPGSFKLAQGESKLVNVKLGLPFDVPAGKYAALLEAAASGAETRGQVQIGPAAATKVYFAVGQAPGVLGAMRQRLNSYWTLYQPWTYLLLMGIDLALIYLLITSILRFSLKFTVEPKKKKPKKKIAN